MRTTVDIDQNLLKQLRERADKVGLSFRETLNQVIHRGLAASVPKREPYVMPVLNLGLDPAINYDKINAYLDDLEDEERLRKMNLDRLAP